MREKGISQVFMQGFQWPGVWSVVWPKETRGPWKLGWDTIRDRGIQIRAHLKSRWLEFWGPPSIHAHSQPLCFLVRELAYALRISVGIQKEGAPVRYNNHGVRNDSWCLLRTYFVPSFVLWSQFIATMPGRNDCEPHFTDRESRAQWSDHIYISK